MGSASESGSGVFSDFCAAWVSRFPGSELPAAWEEDVRANLKKHRTKVSILREELEKEEMYVEYLDKLLADIELHRKGGGNGKAKGGDAGAGTAEGAAASKASSEENASSSANRRLNGNSEAADSGERRRQFLEDHLEDRLERTSLHLDLGAVKSAAANGDASAFVTVINVPSPEKEKRKAGLAAVAAKKKQSSDSALLHNKPPPPKAPPKRSSLTSAVAGSRDSLDSPTTPASPRFSYAEDFMAANPREGMNTLDPKDPLMRAKLSSSSEETLDEDDALRGRPDGRDHNEEHNGKKAAPLVVTSDKDGREIPSKSTKIKELLANWENRPPIGAKPAAKLPHNSGEGRSPTSRSSQRKDSDSSSRGRMGSPSGKSHDSSDSEHSWSRLRSGDAETSPSTRRRISGETRLDRLVRRPSGDRAVPVPVLPKPSKKPVAKPRTFQADQQQHAEEPLYDTVANDDPEDEYDNHLLYTSRGSAGGRGKTDTISSSGGGSSSATDLGFVDEAPSPHASIVKSTQSLTGSGTLSSSEGGSSSSLRRAVSVEEEEEGNYVNIQYFLQKRQDAKASTASAVTMDTIQSDDEFDESDDHKVASSTSSRELLDQIGGPSGVKDVSEEDEVASTSSQVERLVMYKCILNSIVESEAIYLEGLSVMLQYMKAMKVTMTTSQPVIPREDFEVIFYKIPELHELHYTFHESLKRQVDRSEDGGNIGHTFKMLASRTKIYASFLDNYQRALDCLHRCSGTHQQFADLTKSIKLRSVKGQKQAQSLSLEDLLHKPVQRVQKLSLCLQDLIRCTPSAHPDRAPLGEALDSVRRFLSEYNVTHASELFPHHERRQRHLVKNSFVVELSDGARKLRHLFLFNDVLVCAKYKAAARRTEKFAFQIKWYIPLWNCLIVEEPSSEPKESSPANLVSLRTQASSLRDQIYRVDKEEAAKASNSSSASVRRASSNSQQQQHGSPPPPSKASEKFRKKLVELEAQLVLASPSLLFQVTHKNSGRSYSFFLSSEYERSQWVETLQVLQTSLPTNPTLQHRGSSQPPQPNMSMDELQAWITSCRRSLATNMGSFLMRSPRDEPLLVGDLHLAVERLQGLTRPSELFVVAEVDSYGHFFRKAKTRTAHGSLEPTWEEEFVMELEGSENLRILVYEEQQSSTNNGQPSVVLRGRATLELSRTWLTGEMVEQRISMNDVVLTCAMKFVPFEESLRRVPQVPSSSGGLRGNRSDQPGLFGTTLAVVTKRESRPVPFIVTSCVREVERRGLGEVGIYRVSGSAADVNRLRRAYETNPYEAEQLLKECDVHSVAGALKQYLRDLPECLFTAAVYRQLFQAYHEPDHERRKHVYLQLFAQVPQSPNQACCVFLIEHIVRVAQCEAQNKMSLHNLATVFGPTMLHPGVDEKAAGGGGRRGQKNSVSSMQHQQESLATGTVDVMAQAGILHFFISRRARGEPIQIVERQV